MATDVQSNGSFTLTDWSGSTLVYKSTNGVEKGVKEGDIVTVVGTHDTYNGTVELVGGDVTDVKPTTTISLADFLALPDGEDNYMVTGTIKEIVNDKYGNVYITDGTNELYLYGLFPGYGATGDAFHITSPAEDGEGAGMAMKLAMKEAGVAPEQIDYINAHGTSTHHNDLFETKAIKFALGDAAKNVSINSTKSMIGHLLGAAGGVEFVVCVKSIQDGFIHQTVGTENVDPECDLDYTVGAPAEKDVNYVLTNSLGFGGHNATLLLKKYED